MSEREEQTLDLSQIIVPADAIPKPMVTCTVEGILDEGDLRELMLGVEAAAGEPLEIEDPSDLKKIRERHHSVARMIAGGLSQRMVAQLCGYTESYLSILLNNPAMQELIELYRIQHGSAQQIAIEKLRTVGMKALEALDKDLDANLLTKQEKLSLAKLGLDRGELGPSSTSKVLREDHIFDHAELQRRNADARNRNAPFIVPAEDVRKALAPPPKQTETEDESTRDLGSEGPDLFEDRRVSGREIDGE